MLKQEKGLGKTIRALRKARGVTMKELSRQVGITSVAMGRIERGEGDPSVATLRGLSEGLSMSVDCLLRGDAARAWGRPLVDIGRKEPVPESLQARLRRIMDAYAALEETCRATSHSSIPLVLRPRPNEAGMSELGTNVRALMGIGGGIIFDYFELFESFGLRVVSLPLGGKHHSLSFLDKSANNVFIFVESELCPERQIFRLAAELGLIYLDGTGLESELDLPRRLARKFAAFFLMPEASVRSATSRLGVLDGRWPYDLLLRVKSRFGVSAEAFLYRLDELQLIHKKHFEEFKVRIGEHYESNGHAEPGVPRHANFLNTRVWDLALRSELWKGMRSQALKQMETLKRNGLPEQQRQN